MVGLRTERLLLPPQRWDDVNDVQAYAQDEEWSRYLRRVVSYAYTRADAEEWVARTVIARSATNFGVEFEGHVIGSITLRVDATEKRAELGYGIKVEHWGKGLMPEAAGAIIRYGFRDVGLERIYAPVDVRNPRSQRVLEKLGFQREGVLCGHEIGRDGTRIDHVYFGLLREEWECGSASPRRRPG